jgi:predicted DNA-binding WGR domain protein/uncharacterized protein YwqG
VRRFEFKEGSSNKFWEVTLADNTLTVHFGRVVSKGQEKATTFPRPELAQKEHDKLIAEKLRKGYKEVAATDAGQSGPSASTSAGKSKAPGDILSAVKQCEPLKRVAAQLNSLQRLSLRITTAPARVTNVGISRLGGRPDLPAGVSWPIGKVAGREIALPFIAQFDVAWLWRSYIGPGAIGLLPTSGMLYFFYNMADYDADYLAPENWRVIYHHSGDNSNLAPSAPPMPIPPHLDYKARAVKFQIEITLPNIETCYIGGPGNSDAKVELSEEEWSAYAGLLNELRAKQNIHQMFGHADDVQPYALENSYERVRSVFFPDGRPFQSLTPKEQNEEFLQGRVLLQVDEEKSSKMQFGRGGRLFFFIREQDLKARDFSKVWVNEQ